MGDHSGDHWDVEMLRAQLAGLQRDSRERLALLEGERARAVARSETLALNLEKERRGHQAARNLAIDAERALTNLADAWLQVCREGCVPQYEDVGEATYEGVLHGVRQLSAIVSNEKVAHARTKHKLAEAKKRVVELSNEVARLKAGE